MRWTSSAKHPIATGSLKGEAHRCHNLCQMLFPPPACQRQCQLEPRCFQIQGIFTWKSWKSWNRNILGDETCSHFSDPLLHWEGGNRTSNHVANRHNLSCEVHCWLLPQSWQVWVSTWQHSQKTNSDFVKNCMTFLKFWKFQSKSVHIKIHQGTWSICIEVLCHCHCHMHIILC